MVARLVGLSARHPLFVLFLAVGLGFGGWLALNRIPLDALPDLSDTQVILTTEWPGRSPELVEQQLTARLSAAFLSAPKVRAVRGQSFFGVSFVYVIFEDGTDLYWARSRVAERLQSLGTALPAGVKPAMGPDGTGVGWVLEYALVDRTGHSSLADLRAIQDWDLKRALESVPGVAEVATIGGLARAWEVTVDPWALVSKGIGIDRVVAAIRSANTDAAGHVLTQGDHELMLRGRGLLQTRADLAAVAVPGMKPTDPPIRVDTLGPVGLAAASRRGIAELDGEGEVVGGVVIARAGENALQVIERVKERLDALRSTLPAGAELVLTYDRSTFIGEAIDTLRTALLEELAVVSLVILIFLMHVRSALVVCITLPLAVLASFIPMLFQGLGANIMSLGGIIVAIGDMVDGAIVLVENVHKRLEPWHAAGEPGGKVERRRLVTLAMQEVAPSLFGSLLILTVAFLPVLALESAEGRLFGPLAWTKTWSMGFGAVLAVTIAPALVALLVRGRLVPESQNPLNRLLVWLYTPAVRWVVRHRWLVMGLAAALVAFTVPALLRLESEFMPPLEETDLLYMPTSPPGMPDDVAVTTLQTMDRIIKGFPEVQHVFGKAGRAETATDPAPLAMFETVIQLKPRSEWPEGETLDQLKKKLDAALAFPGMPNLLWMPVQTRTEMLATGVRANLGIQVYGSDPKAIEAAGIAVERALTPLRGTASAYADRETGGFYLDGTIRRDVVARLGLSVDMVAMLLEAAVGGMPIAEASVGRTRIPIAVRFPRDWRTDPDQLARIPVPLMGKGVVPLGTLVEFKSTMGPMMIRSEAGKLLGTVIVGVDETVRTVPDYVAEAEPIVRALDLPSGVHVVFSGTYQSYERAKARLSIVIPVTLALVVLLLLVTTGSLAETGIVLLAVPFSLVGAVWLVWFLGYKLSVAVVVGMIALAGLDAETGVVMLLYLKLSHRRHADEGRLVTHRDLMAAIVEGAAQRIRPKLMTVLVNVVGLVPVLLSTGIGSDVMRRIAAPVLGGVVTSFLLELLVYPAIFAAWKGFSTVGERTGAPLRVPS